MAAPWDLNIGSQRRHFTFTAGWSEVVHQEAKEVVELQKEREKNTVGFCFFFSIKKIAILCLMV